MFKNLYKDVYYGPFLLEDKNPPANTGDMYLVQEDPTCGGTTKPMSHNYWARALKLRSHNCWALTPQLLKPSCSKAPDSQLVSPCATTTEAHAPGTCAAQEEKSPQWEAWAPQQQGSLLSATGESPCAATKTQCSQKYINMTVCTCPKIFFKECLLGHYL